MQHFPVCSQLSRLTDPGLQSGVNPFTSTGVPVSSKCQRHDAKPVTGTQGEQPNVASTTQILQSIHSD